MRTDPKRKRKAQSSKRKRTGQQTRKTQIRLEAAEHERLEAIIADYESKQRGEPRN